MLSHLEPVRLKIKTQEPVLPFSIAMVIQFNCIAIALQLKIAAYVGRNGPIFFLNKSL